MTAPFISEFGPRARLLPVRWRRSAWFPTILNRDLELNRDRDLDSGLNLGRLSEWSNQSRRQWLFSRTSLVPVAVAVRRHRKRTRRRLEAALRFRPFNVFSSTELRCSIFSPLTQHPGL